MLFSAYKWRGALPPLSGVLFGLVLLLNVVGRPQILHVEKSSYVKDANISISKNTPFSDSPKPTAINKVYNDISVNQHNHSDTPFSVRAGKMELSVQNPELYDPESFWKTFEEESMDPNCLPLNRSFFRLPHKRYRRGEVKTHPHIPRFMMEYFAEGEHARTLPEGATVVRSFPAIVVEEMAAHEITDSDRRNIAKTIPSYFSFGDEKENNASEQKLSSADGEPSYSRRFSNTKEDSDGKIVKNEDKTDSNATHNGSNISKISKYQNTENLSSSLHVNDLSEKREKTDRNVYKFTFNLIFPPREEVHSAVFRIYTRTRRKPDEIIGVERKIRLYINTETEDLRDASRILVVEQNVYLLNSSWIDLDISPAVRVFKKNKSNAHNIEVEISADFLSVGGKGILEVVTAFASSLRPYLLIYGTSHKALYRENQEKVSHRVKRSTSSAEWEEEDGNSVWDDVEVFTGFPPQVNKGKKLGRKARRRRAKNSCKRKPLRVEFKEIDWDHWIIAPQTYEAYQCSGKCYYPLPSHLSPTKHAVIQNLIHSKQPESASRACCVPTELGPISLLYLEANVPTFNYDYSEMVVLECGCR